MTLSSLFPGLAERAKLSSLRFLLNSLFDCDGFTKLSLWYVKGLIVEMLCIVYGEVNGVCLFDMSPLTPISLFYLGISA